MPPICCWQVHIGETRHVKTIHLLRSKGYENVHGWASTAYFSVWHLVNSTEALRPVPSAPAEAGIGVTWGGEHGLLHRLANHGMAGLQPTAVPKAAQPSVAVTWGV